MSRDEPPSSKLLRTCFSSAVRRSPSCSSSDGSHANSLSSRTPCRSSEVNFTRRSRSAIVRRVKAPILRESCVLSGIEKTMMKMPARPATPRKLQSITYTLGTSRDISPLLSPSLATPRKRKGPHRRDDERHRPGPEQVQVRQRVPHLRGVDLHVGDDGA